MVDFNMRSKEGLKIEIQGKEVREENKEEIKEK